MTAVSSNMGSIKIYTTVYYMRLWSFHPAYLDSRGLVALWRESLLALAVLQGRTNGYRHHPQLTRFRDSEDPVKSIGYYLSIILIASRERNFNFNSSKIPFCNYDIAGSIPVPAGQVRYEWAHFIKKIMSRDMNRYLEVKGILIPCLHPLFHGTEGGVEPWEKTH